MRRHLLLAGAALFGLTACTGEETPGDGDTTTTPKNQLTVKTPVYEVPEGESFECFYTDVVTDKDLSVISAAGTQGPGGHHIIVYYTGQVRDPEHHPCQESEMVSWHQVVGANGLGTGEPAIAMPDGLAIKVPAGNQIVLQTHYINVSGKAQEYSDQVDIALAEPEDIVAYANLFAISDLGFKVEPQASTTSVTETTLSRDAQIVLLGGHMHEHGKSFKLELLDAAGAVQEVLYDEQWSAAYASHPPLLTYTVDSPRVLKEGMHMRQTCVWDNASPDTFQFPTEMCVTFGFYYPDEGEIINLSKPPM